MLRAVLIPAGLDRPGGPSGPGTDGGEDGRDWWSLGRPKTSRRQRQ
ncbi:MAG: hypothetical protein JO114_18055 [Planctomycetaceae bacterium]|nr:hypothetical protein [Planctomycetaceae bacterium]MBV8310535.1 hypothetical protein [Planctomycetaceae bacterium]